MKTEKLKVGSQVKIISKKGTPKHRFNIGDVVSLITIENDLKHEFMGINFTQFVSPEDYKVIRY